jgi:hypothetical protein
VLPRVDDDANVRSGGLGEIGETNPVERPQPDVRDQPSRESNRKLPASRVQSRVNGRVLARALHERAKPGRERGVGVDYQSDLGLQIRLRQ